MRGNQLALGNDLFRGAVERTAADRDAARAERAGAVGHPIGVAFDDVDVSHRDAEPDERICANDVACP